MSNEKHVNEPIHELIVLYMEKKKLTKRQAVISIAEDFGVIDRSVWKWEAGDVPLKGPALKLTLRIIHELKHGKSPQEVIPKKIIDLVKKLHQATETT